MALTNTQYDKIKRIYDERQLRRHYESEKRIQYLNDHVKGYKDLSDTIASLSVAKAQLLFDGDEHALDNLKSSIDALIAQKKELIKKAGLPEDYLDVPYECPDCKDTGYINGEKCHCFKQAIITELYNQSNLQGYLEKTDFNLLSDQYYQGDALLHFKDSLEKSLNFVKNFHNDYQNLCFYGTVGSGKSFLSGCIAKEILKKGYSVIYLSATSLMDIFAKHAFDYNNPEEDEQAYDDIYNCDLLIIDDLGTEAMNKFTNGRLFTCLNERSLRKKSIIISTNFSIGELKEHYGERVFSRLNGNFIFCKMSGKDIRMM